MVPDAVVHAVRDAEVDEPGTTPPPRGAPGSLEAPFVSAGRSATGDESFDAFFLDAYPRLVRSVTVVCGDHDLAADCVADAFERAFVRWWRIGRYDDPTAWVRRVAINRATDHHRRRARGRRAVERLAAREDHIDHRQPDDRLGSGDPRLGAALAALPERQRLAMVLFYVEDQSIAEVAVAMKISEGAVKFHLHRGRAALRERLGIDGGER